jgi:hypothetical protein
VVEVVVEVVDSVVVVVEGAMVAIPTTARLEVQHWEIAGINQFLIPLKINKAGKVLKTGLRRVVIGWMNCRT